MRPLPRFLGRTSGRSRSLALFVIYALCSAVFIPAMSVNAQERAETPEAPNVYRPLYDFTGDARTDFTTVNVNTASPGTPIVWRTLRNPGIPGPGNAFIR